MNKKFTLAELIIAVVVISLLASIVIVKILDMKNKSIGAAVANNTKIIQTAVDRFALDNNGDYPIKNDLIVNLANPQLIDVARLKEGGYLKKELDTSKIKNQYYWLDVFGIGWGSTEKTVENLTSVSGKDGKTYLEFITPTGATSYRVYEVVGYNGSGEITNKKDRHYKFITEVELKKKRQKVNFEIPNSSKTYLISIVDKYEQETAPVGVFYKGPAGFNPITSREGTYEFEIESIDEMFWIEYVAIQDTPGASTITYRFKVKDKDGVYGEWTEDFNSLSSSKGIFVEVNMKGDTDGNKPSLYDLRIVYRYAYEEDFPLPPVVVTKPSDNHTTCPTPNVVSTFVDGKWIDGQSKLFTYLVDLPKDKNINSIERPSFYGYSIIAVKYQYADQTGNYVFAKGTYDIPSGSCVNLIYEVIEEVKTSTGSGNPAMGGGSGSGSGGDSDIGTGSAPTFHSPPVVKVCESKCLEVCTDCNPACLENCADHCEKQNCTEEEWCKRYECIEPPICEEGDSNCIPPVCTDNCFAGRPPTAPNPKDLELKDTDWVTVETLRFFAHGPDEVPTRWYKMIADDEQDEVNTRILYRFAASNGYYWSNEYEEITEVGQSQSLLVVAYLQVHKDVKDNPSQQPPVVNSIKVLHERGEVNLDMLKPTLTILPKKNNNEGRDVFSDASVFEWGYMAFDPKGKKLSGPEWIGKETTYPIGIHTIQARVKNDTDMWSSWTPYTFEVLPEKPIAKITKSTPMVLKGKNVEWSAAQSYDPDGDAIVKTEWRGDKLSVYDKEGTYTVGLRVQDSEGNWSDWVEETVKVTDSGVVVYRIEAEDSDTTNVVATAAYGGSNTVVNGTNYSNGQARTQFGAYTRESSSTVIYFKGTGFDLNIIGAKEAIVTLDGALIDTVNASKIVSQRGLENINHRIQITTSGSANQATIDYVDIYDTVDKPSISNVYSRNIDSLGKEDITNSNTIVSSMKQQLKVYYKLHKDAYVTVKVYDKSKRLIKTISTKEKNTGGTINTHSVIWDGSSDSVNYLETGVYTLEIYALGVEEKESMTFSYPVILDNEKPTKSFEAEGTLFPKNPGYGGSAQILSYKGAREDKVFQMNGGYTSDVTASTVTFSGTGFDLKTVAGTGSISVDNGPEVPLNGNHTYSKRGLTNGSHTVRITTKGSKQSLSIDYLDVYEESDVSSVVSTYSRIVLGAKEDTVNNNKFSSRINQSMKLTYSVSRNAKTTVNIVDKEKKLVKNLVSNQESLSSPTGIYSAVWDGKNESNEHSVTETYFFEVKTEGVRGSINTYYYEIGLDNTPPAMRLEGESTAFINSKAMGGVAMAYAYPGASGDKVLYLGGAYTRDSSSSTVTFTGTGFDLKLVYGTTGSVVVDKRAAITISAPFPYIYSVRDLDYGTHTIRITTTSSNQLLYVDYLDVYR